MRKHRTRVCAVCVAVLCVLLVAAYPASEPLGQLEFAPAGKIEKQAGVWVDGTYVGIASGIKVMLVPGEHQVVIRHGGYRDLVSTVAIEPQTLLTLPVRLERDIQAAKAAPNSDNAGKSSGMKIVVKPSRAAVFLNDAFVGHVDEFNGFAQGMVLPPGTYHVRIALAGYRPFETTVTLLPAQNFELKTNLSPEPAETRGQ